MSAPLRKTVSRQILVDRVNASITVLATPEERRAVIAVLEGVLLADGGNAYAGFTYLPSEREPDGFALRPDYDHTMRRYY